MKEGIKQRLIATMNPRSNGQVERYNAVIKAGIRKFSSACPDGCWWEFLQDIARSCRILPSASTGVAPYLLVFKQPPAVPLPEAFVALDDDDVIENSEQHLGQ